MESENTHAAWLERQPAAKKDGWLAQWMADPHSTVRREILAEFQMSRSTRSWPTVRLDRSIAELQAAAEEIAQEADQRKAEAASRQRAKKLSDMAANPARTLRETEQLLKQRSTDAYSQVAELLADLREALAGSAQADLAETQARKLKASHPTLKMLTSALRAKGFLKK